MTKKESFIQFCEQNGIELEVLSYEQLVENEGKDGIEDFTGKEVNPGESVFWFTAGEPLFYCADDNEDLSDKAIDDMLL